MNKIQLTDTQGIKGRKTLFSLVCLTPLIIIVFLGIHISHRGSQLADIEHEIAELKARNEQIELQIVKSTSLTELSDTSNDLGYVNSENVIYFDKPANIAVKLQ